MVNKSDVLVIFQKFKVLVENLFGCNIKHLQSDWGGEYRSLSRFLSPCGIAHRISCPHTHEQNGAAERKYRHIIETGLSLMAHSNVPVTYWNHAFEAAVYLINRLSIPSLDNLTPLDVWVQPEL